MEGNIIFKTSMRGFDKKEVMAYIAEICQINAMNVDALERVTADAKNLFDEVETLRLANAELVKQNSDLTNSLSEANDKIDELNEEISKLNGELSDLNNKASKVDDIEGAEVKANKLMMDSLRYSESCIKNARKVTASINMSTKKKINKAKDCLNTVSGDFKSLTDQIELSISEISERLANLSDGLDEI